MTEQNNGSAHTGEPWRVNTAGHGNASGFVLDEVYVYAPDCGIDDVAVAADIADPLTGEPSQANAERICTCINAMAGLSNEQVSTLREANKRLREALTRITAIENKMYGGDWDEIGEARLIASEAVAKEMP